MDSFANFASEGGKKQVYFSCYEKVGYRLSLD